MPHSAHCRSVSKRVCYWPTMPAGKIFDHTKRCQRARVNHSLRWYHCSSTAPASELFCVPATRDYFAPIKNKQQTNTVHWFEEKKMGKKEGGGVRSSTDNTLFKSFRNHFSRMPWVGAVWFDLTKFHIPSKLLTSLVSDSLRAAYVGYRREWINWVRNLVEFKWANILLSFLPWIEQSMCSTFFAAKHHKTEY